MDFYGGCYFNLFTLGYFESLGKFPNQPETWQTRTNGPYKKKAC